MATLTATNKANLAEVAKCKRNLPYFISQYCQVLASKASGDWKPFTLWPAQEKIADDLVLHRMLVMLKARQLGFTWEVVAYLLRQALLFPVQTILVFSKRDDEAVELVDYRLREMYERLPPWMRQTKLLSDKSHEISFPNGSRVKAFTTKGGRSYTGTIAVIDEADQVQDLDKMISAVKPTVDAGGQLILLSTSDKSKPESLFKNIYRAAKSGQNQYHPIFHGWSAAPWRTQEWYDRERRAMFAETGSDDLLHQEYPATDLEALAPRSLDKRIPAEWLQQCFQELGPLDSPLLPSIPSLVAYQLPIPGRKYVVGLDPAEGNPTSDDSAATVLDCITGEEVAMFAGKHDPAVFASYAYAVATFYNHAAVMCERNNHGHAVLLWLTNFGQGVWRLKGKDDREGWLSSNLGKTILYDACAEAFRNNEIVLHSFDSFTQLGSIEGNTLRAPEGLNDDKADSMALAVAGRPAALNAGTVEIATGNCQLPFTADKPASLWGDRAPWDEEDSTDPYAPRFD